MAERRYGWAFTVLGAVIIATVPFSAMAGDPIWPVALILGAAALLYGALLRRLR